MEAEQNSTEAGLTELERKEELGDYDFARYFNEEVDELDEDYGFIN